ncbi:MAG: glycosyltransferase family 2 protein, partial [Deltaproteobacteria bacterium]|nr:glycosyltransferase family 2 protein [Deltaproteobacteria bacterium]
MPNVPAEVSVIIVTHNSARYLGDCLATLRAQGMGVRLIVVDNASRPAERPACSDCDEVEVILNTVNRGFAPAVNQGLKRVCTPYVLLLNPDVCLMPDALVRLRAFLAATPQAAAVSPRFWWDTARTALLPLTVVPTLTRLVARVMAARSRVVRAVLDRWQIHQARRWWFAQGAVEVPAISAACVLIPTRVLERVGRLDPQFPFYYEEVEWSLRARRCRYRLYTLPTAEAVHSFGHSARKGSQRVKRWAAVSGRRYWRMRYGQLGARLAAALSAQPVKTVLAPTYDLGVIAEPPSLMWSTVAHPQVLEVAFDPLFESTAAIFPAGNEFRWPAALWS